MQDIERIPALEGAHRIQWRRVFLESVLAIAGALLITWLIAIYHLYPRIPNISIVYLLPVLLFSVLFGRLSAILTAIVAFLSFDFFLVPPFYTLTIDRAEDWIALVIFLITALLTSQIAEVMRRRTEEARLRERESRILYEVIRIVNMQELLEDELGVIMLALRRVFAPWGIDQCGLLLPDAQGALSLLADSSMEVDAMKLLPEEQATAVSVLQQGLAKEERTAPPPEKSGEGIAYYKQTGPVTTTRFLPLKIGEQVVAVLCLRLHRPVSWLANLDSMHEGLRSSNTRVDFFWTFLEQATSLIERAQLRSVVRSRQQ
jgi:two-component system sensor histidine kinase KdpD